jgi:NDP-sugar pyrophosphorylase family protein
MIEGVVGDGSKLGVNVSYSPDGPILLGTGGALRQALPMLGSAFFVLYGDSFLPVDFVAVEASYRSCSKPALMTVMRNADRWDKSNVIFNNGELMVYDKHRPHPEMEFIDYGLSILSAEVLESYPVGHAFDLAGLYTELSKAGELAGLEVHERFYEIGSHEGLSETEDFFLRKNRA